MREIIHEKIGEEERCPYLDDQRSKMRYRFVRNCSAKTYQHMLERGWRRFGSVFFRPGCPACSECRSLRLDVDAFVPNRSMRRTWRKNQDLQILIGQPSLSEAHLELYSRYHADMARRRGWKDKTISPLDYFMTFIEGYEDFGHELLYLHDNRLVGVALTDVLPNAVSAVYCFYEPEMRQRSLGVFSILQQVHLARKRGVPHLYLGYWVAGNQSMRYKAQYRPHEILKGRPELDQQPIWS